MTVTRTPHLTHEQICALLLERPLHPLSSDFAAMEQHLGVCAACAEELSRLTGSLASFREAATAFAQRQWVEARGTHQATLYSPRRSSRPLLWACAAALALAALIPLGLRRHGTATPAHGPSEPAYGLAGLAAPAAPPAANAPESDEALLNEVDQDISASVPSPMRPLENPTGADGISTTTTTDESN